MQTPAEIDAYLQTTYARTPVVFERGEGCWLWDGSGSRYLDFVAGIATCSLGHAHPAIRAALHEQSDRIMHVSNLYYTSPQGELACWLVDHSCADRVFFCNSGTEANEAAIKLARKFSHRKHGTAEPVIIAAVQSFHGRTLGALTATGQAKYQHGFEPLLPGFVHVPYNDPDALETAVASLPATSRLAGILLEPLQGEGGIIPGSKAFFLKAREICDAHDAALMFDEVQCGMGRSGKLWGYEILGVEPDIFTSAKGLGGGFPVGAMLAKGRFAVFQPGDHASTFGGNPLAAAVALTVSRIIGDEAFLAQVRERGEELASGLQQLASRFPEHVSAVRGWGLLQGLVLAETSALTASAICARAVERKLLLVGAGPKVVRFVPPLIVSSREIQQALSILEEIFSI